MKALAFLVAIAGCVGQTQGVVLRTEAAEFRVLSSGYVSGALVANGQKESLDEPGDGPTERIRVDGTLLPEVPYDVRTAQIRKGRIEVHSRGNGALQKMLAVEARADVPGLAVITVTLRNTGHRELRIDRVEYNRHRFNTGPDVWTFQGASDKWGQVEIAPVTAGFTHANKMGVPSPTGEGGGLPVVALWNRQMGVAVGHIEPRAQVLSFPVRASSDNVIATSTVVEPDVTLKPGETWTTPRAFLAVYRGDYYEALRAYAKAVPIPPMNPGPEAYKIAWCGWGFSFGVTPDQMLGAIPKLKELHLDWATLDDGWFQTYGDWNPRPATFPGHSVEDLVAAYHRQGIRVQLWWYPLAVEDGVGKYISHKYRPSDVVREHPDWLILDKNGKHARFARDLAVLCPALPEVREYHKQLTERFLRDWGFDGSKLDVVYSVPPCYNPKHHHKRPEESIEAIGDVYRTIYETSLALKPDSVTQICPCGTTPNIGWLPFENQAVAADPHGSLQIRERIKMYKALFGPRAAVTGDHVEYTGEDFGGTDFASTVALGGVPSSRFTWPGYGPDKTLFLDDAKSDLYRKWIELYQSRMLSTGEFRNLYIHGFDTPEGYAISAKGRMYYAFFAPGADHWQTTGRWRGEIELRGLAPGQYQVVDYEHSVEMGTIDARSPKMQVDFDKHLLLEVSATATETSLVR